jgi:hypothetical protein
MWSGAAAGGELHSSGKAREIIEHGYPEIAAWNFGTTALHFLTGYCRFMLALTSPLPASFTMAQASQFI